MATKYVDKHKVREYVKDRIGKEYLNEPLSRKLSKGFPDVRVDFYLWGDYIIFGEMTFFHFSGTKNFTPEKYDDIFGSYID